MSCGAHVRTCRLYLEWVWSSTRDSTLFSNMSSKSQGLLVVSNSSKENHAYNAHSPSHDPPRSHPLSLSLSLSLSFFFFLSSDVYTHSLFVEYGMPSSHAQFMAFFATYFTLFLFFRLVLAIFCCNLQPCLQAL